MTKKMTHKKFLFAFAAFALLGAQSTFAMEEKNQPTIRQLNSNLEAKRTALQDLQVRAKELKNKIEKAEIKKESLRGQILYQKDILKADLGTEINALNSANEEVVVKVTQEDKDAAEKLIKDKTTALEEIGINQLNKDLESISDELEVANREYKNAEVSLLQRRKEDLEIDKKLASLQLDSLEVSRELEKLKVKEGRLSKSMSSVQGSKPLPFTRELYDGVDSPGEKRKKIQIDIQKPASWGNELGLSDNTEDSLFGDEINENPLGDDFDSVRYEQEDSEDDEGKGLHSSSTRIRKCSKRKTRKKKSRRKKKTSSRFKSDVQDVQQERFASRMIDEVGNLYAKEDVVKPADSYSKHLRKEVGYDLITPDNLPTVKGSEKIATDAALEVIKGGSYNWYNWTYKLPTRMISWSLELVGIKTANKVAPEAYYAIHAALLNKQTANYKNGFKLSQEISDLGVGYKGTIAENMDVAHEAVAITKYGSTKVNSDITKAAGQIKYVQGKIVQTLQEQFKEFAKLSAVEQEEQVTKYAVQEERSAKRAYLQASSLLEVFDTAVETNDYSYFDSRFDSQQQFKAAHEEARNNEMVALENCEKAQARLRQLQQYKKQMPNKKQRAKLVRNCFRVALMSPDDVNDYRVIPAVKLKVDEKYPTTIAGFETVIQRTANEKAQEIDKGTKERFNPAPKKKDENKEEKTTVMVQL